MRLANKKIIMDLKYMFLFATMLTSITAETVRSCESTTLTLSCSPGYKLMISAANYGRSSNTYCVDAQMSNLNCISSSSLNIVKAACENNQTCQISASNSVFGDPCVGTSKYLEVTYDCVPASYNKQVCEREVLHLNCPRGYKIQILEANYGRTTDQICIHKQMENLNCLSSNSLNIVKAACDDKNRCNVAANNDVFGDPCIGTYKYLDVNYQCIPDTNNKRACESEVLNLDCPQGYKLQISEANYGRTSDQICRHKEMHNLNCYSSNTLSIVRAACENKQSCQISSNNHVFGDPCFGTYKYLDVYYQCVPDINNKKACETETLNLDCPEGYKLQISDANYGRTSDQICRHKEMHNLNCFSSNSLSIVKAACENKQRCQIASSNNVFGDPCFGTYKYLDVNYQCVPDNNNKRACETEVLNLDCPDRYKLQILEANYGRTSDQICRHKEMHNLNCLSKNSLNIVKATCENKQNCQISSNNHVFGDPCVGTYKYLDVYYQCIPDTNNRRACESEDLNLDCPEGYRLDIIEANYGRTSDQVCKHKEMHNLNCFSPNSLSIVKAACGNKQRCQVSANNNVFGDPCYGTYKYLDVYYQCVPATYNTIHVCEHDSFHLVCPKNEPIIVINADYGRTDPGLCERANRNSLQCKSSTALNILTNLCNKKTSCTIKANNDVFGDPCHGTTKYVTLEYLCG